MLEGLSGEQLAALAAPHLHDNLCPGDPGFHEPANLAWTVERLTPAQLANVFPSRESALAWLADEIAMDIEEGLHRGWATLLEEDIREAVIVVIENGLAHLWDGFHRTAAGIARMRPTLAIVGRPR